MNRRVREGVYTLEIANESTQTGQTEKVNEMSENT
jgi:hypothetical protein